MVIACWEMVKVHDIEVGRVVSADYQTVIAITRGKCKCILVAMSIPIGDSNIWWRQHTIKC